MFIDPVLRSRREFLALLTATGVLSACSSDGSEGSGEGVAQPASSTSTTLAPTPSFAASPFVLGVASGDPLPSGVILWTRLVADELTDDDIVVSWELSTEPDFAEIVSSGETIAVAALGHSVHHDATGLDPATEYWYRFRVGDHESSVGRTKTAPDQAATPGEVRFAHASCQRYQSGFFTAHRHLAEEQVDFVVWLGDYIYENAGNPDDTESPRTYDGPETVTLEEYRDRYALYRLDEDLQACHASAPWIVTWDDHEVDNNYAGVISQDDAPGEASLAERRADAYQAWYEHMPVRLAPPDPASETYEIHRSFSFGTLVDLFVIDTRQYRTDQPCEDGFGVDITTCDDLDEPGRTILGDDQKAWLFDGLETSPATWKVLGNQVTMARLGLGDLGFSFDGWDGYPAERDELFSHLTDNGIDNTVVLTGDTHFSAAGHLHSDFNDPTSPIVAHEFVGTSISSANPPETIALVGRIEDLLFYSQYVNAELRGYQRHTVTPGGWTTDYRVVSTALEPGGQVSTDATFEIQPGTIGMTRRT